MKTFWDERYAGQQYVYGKEPNVFFRQELDKLSPSRLLLPAEGEGRNAVYAAGHGWEVDAFDYSGSALKKASQLAQEKKVTINYMLSDLQSFKWPENTYNAIGLFFVHLQPADRIFLHEQAMKALQAGGVLILEGFAKEQLPLSSGGPKNLEMLFSKTMLAKDFSDFSLQLLERESVILNEGAYHRGHAEVIRMIVKK